MHCRRLKVCWMLKPGESRLCGKDSSRQHAMIKVHLVFSEALRYSQWLMSPTVDPTQNLTSRSLNVQPDETSHGSGFRTMLGSSSVETWLRGPTYTSWPNRLLMFSYRITCPRVETEQGSLRYAMAGPPILNPSMPLVAGRESATVTYLISYADVFVNTGSESIGTTVRTRQILFAYARGELVHE